MAVDDPQDLQLKAIQFISVKRLDCFYRDVAYNLEFNTRHLLTAESSGDVGPRLSTPPDVLREDRTPFVVDDTHISYVALRVQWSGYHVR